MRLIWVQFLQSHMVPRASLGVTAECRAKVISEHYWICSPISQIKNLKEKKLICMSGMSAINIYLNWWFLCQWSSPTICIGNFTLLFSLLSNIKLRDHVVFQRKNCNPHINSPFKVQQDSLSFLPIYKLELH